MPDIVTNELYTEIDRLTKRVKELEAERDAAVKWLEEYKSKTYCAYCRAIFNIDSDASHVSEHIRTCPHHPMRELEAENDELDRIAVTMCRQKNELEAENKRLRAALENVLLAIDHEDYYNDAVFDEAREALKLAGKEGE